MRCGVKVLSWPQAPAAATSCRDSSSGGRVRAVNTAKGRIECDKLAMVVAGHSSVLAGMAEALLHGSGPYLQDAEAAWAHMVRVGPLARGLARGFGVPPHEAFLLGLLHDVGKLVLFDLLSAVRHELRRAQANGEMKVYEEGYFPQARSTRTRAEVVAELRRAQANGEYALLQSEAFDPVAYETLVAKNRAAEATRLATQPAPAVR